MEIRSRKKKAPLVRALAVGDSAARLLTLEDPEAPVPAEAAGAFVRLRPPEGSSPDAVETWRARAAAVARAVKVLPPPRADDVPLASTRVDVGDRTGTIREEATRLAAETGSDHVVALVGKILDEVGA